MMKRNTSRPMFNKRYFALYEGVLIYYHHEKDYKKDRKNGMVCIVCHIHTLHVIQSYEVLLMCKCFYDTAISAEKLQRAAEAVRGLSNQT